MDIRQDVAGAESGRRLPICVIGQVGDGSSEFCCDVAMRWWRERAASEAVPILQFPHTRAQPQLHRVLRVDVGAHAKELVDQVEPSVERRHVEGRIAILRWERTGASDGKGHYANRGTS